jgi:hypothetical protein
MFQANGLYKQRSVAFKVLVSWCFPVADFISRGKP